MKRHLLFNLALAVGWNLPAAVQVETIDLTASMTPQEVCVVTNAVSVLTNEAIVRIDVDAAAPGQSMDGIGGAFNELGWDALLSLPEQ